MKKQNGTISVLETYHGDDKYIEKWSLPRIVAYYDISSSCRQTKVFTVIGGNLLQIWKQRKGNLNNTV